MRRPPFLRKNVCLDHFRDIVQAEGVGGEFADKSVLFFTLLASVLAGLFFGIIPAWQSSRAEVNEWLKESGRSTEGRGNQSARGFLIIAEVLSCARGSIMSWKAGPIPCRSVWDVWQPGRRFRAARTYSEL